MKECTFKPQRIAAQTTLNLIGAASKIPRILPAPQISTPTPVA